MGTMGLSRICSCKTKLPSITLMFVSSTEYDTLILMARNSFSTMVTVITLPNGSFGKCLHGRRRLVSLPFGLQVPRCRKAHGTTKVSGMLAAEKICTTLKLGNGEALPVRAKT